MTVPFLSSLPTATNATAGTQQQFARFHQVRKPALSGTYAGCAGCKRGLATESKLLVKVGMDFLTSVLDKNQKLEPCCKQLDNLSRACILACRMEVLIKEATVYAPVACAAFIQVGRNSASVSKQN